MNRDDIICMALERFGAVLKPSDLEVKLAALAVAEEREKCAKVCEENCFPDYYTAIRCAQEIRERGET